MKKVTVALTGGIGAGKSTVAKMFAELGAIVISGDDLGRQVLNEDQSVRLALVERLGEDIQNADGSLNRRLIASRAFSHEESSHWLTSLTFPGIYARWKRLSQDADAKVVLFDAALIFEWNIQSEFDKRIAVIASDELSWTRSVGRFSPEDYRKRRASQIADKEKANSSDIVIINDGSLDQLRSQVLEAWQNHIIPLTT